MNWKRLGRKRSWPNFKVLSWNSPGGTEENHRNLNLDSRSTGPRFEPRTLWIRSRSINHSTVTFHKSSMECSFVITSFISCQFMNSSARVLREAPNIVVDWLTLLLLIRELPGSILGPGDRLSWLSFSSFSSVPLGECCDSTLKVGRPLPTASFPINHHLLIMLSSTLCSQVTEKASLNKLPKNQYLREAMIASYQQFRLPFTKQLYSVRKITASFIGRYK
jgi:hypothetical protein